MKNSWRYEMKAPKKAISFVAPESADCAGTIVNVFINGVEVARLAGNRQSLRIEPGSDGDHVQWLPSALEVAKWLVRIGLLVHSLIAGGDVVAAMLEAMRQEP